MLLHDRSPNSDLASLGPRTRAAINLPTRDRLAPKTQRCACRVTAAARRSRFRRAAAGAPSSSSRGAESVLNWEPRRFRWRCSDRRATSRDDAILHVDDRPARGIVDRSRRFARRALLGRGLLRALATPVSRRKTGLETASPMDAEPDHECRSADQHASREPAGRDAQVVAEQAPREAQHEGEDRRHSHAPRRSLLCQVEDERSDDRSEVIGEPTSATWHLGDMAGFGEEVGQVHDPGIRHEILHGAAGGASSAENYQVGAASTRSPLRSEQRARQLHPSRHGHCSAWNSRASPSFAPRTTT